MFNYSINRSFFVLICDEDDLELKKIYKFLHLLDESGVGEIIKKYIKDNLKGGRPQYNPFNMFALILYSFAFTNGSLRNIEEKCAYDIRYMYITSNIKPSYATISNFINDIIKPNIDEIFSLVTKAIFNECKLSMDDVFIDGTKIEADANKYKFVWKPTKYHENLSEKIRSLLKKYNIQNAIPVNGIISSKIISQKVNELDDLVLNGVNNKELNKDYKLLVEYLSKSLEYEEKERICGEKRNSYYKTDHDATTMCLKTIIQV